MVSKAESVVLLEGFSSIVGGLSIPFIHFVDDFIFMLKVDLEGMRSLRCILLILEVVTELKVNLSKSALSPIGDVSNIEELASILACDVVSLPITYLGLPFVVKLSSKTI